MNQDSNNKVNDVFVGNLSFNTTEEHLRQLFSTAGTVTGVRIVIDKDTQKSKGFAFVEFLDAGTALSAIRNLDGHELNNRKLRVSYSNNGSLKDIAKQIGQVIPENPYNNAPTIESVIQSYKLHELYDILESIKQLLDEDQGAYKVKAIFQQYPYLINALQEIQNRLGIQ